MIEHVARADFTVRAFHLSAESDDVRLMRGMRIVDVDAMLAFVRRSHLHDDPNSYIRRPFERKPLDQRASRYSDGTWGVYYAAPEVETTKAEIGHHARGWVRDLGYPVFYRKVEAEFAGNVKDLRDQVAALPCLMAEPPDGYTQCNLIAAEAKAEGLGALRVPAVRRPGSECLPVFVQDSLRNATLGQWFRFEVDAAGAVQITDHRVP